MRRRDAAAVVVVVAAAAPIAAAITLATASFEIEAERANDGQMIVLAPIDVPELRAPVVVLPEPELEQIVVIDDAAEARRHARRSEPVEIEERTGVPQPVDFDCESWAPLLEEFGIPYDEALPVMYRESRCSMAHNYNAQTRDDSWGPLQVNRWGQLGPAWDSIGFDADYMATPRGSVHAASIYYHACGWGPWVKPYSCPNGWPL